MAASNERSRFASVLSTGCKVCTKLKLYLVTHEERRASGPWSYLVTGMFISAENQESALDKAIIQKPMWDPDWIEAIECKEDGVEKEIAQTWE